MRDHIQQGLMIYKMERCYTIIGQKAESVSEYSISMARLSSFLLKINSMKLIAY